MIPKSVRLFACACCLLLTGKLVAQQPEVSRIFTVRDGLPQSYVSGILQDEQGFLWVSTLNGFSRYDGRSFKQYWHNSQDSAGLSSNIILHMLEVGNGQLLLCYLDGRVDLFHTESEKVTHLVNLSFDRLNDEWRYFKSLVTNNKGLCWMIASDGGINQVDIYQNRLEHFTPGQLKLQEPVLGLAVHKQQVLLFTSNQLSIRSAMNQAGQTYFYPFNNKEFFSLQSPNFYSTRVRENGELIMTNAKGFITWNPFTNTHQQLPLPRKTGSGKLIAYTDKAGNYFFEYDGSIYILRPDNTIVSWLPVADSVKGIPTSMYLDRSGVFWVGTNGFGMRQYNLTKTGMPGYTNQQSFIIDVLGHYGVASQANQTFLRHSIPFANRAATWKNKLWIADVHHQNPDPQLVLFSDNTLSVKTFHSSDPAGKKEPLNIKFINHDHNGLLWGIDQQFRLLQFNTEKLTYTVYPKIDLEQNNAINGLVPDEQDIFYISNTTNLYKFDASTGETINLTSNLPSKDLLTISNDVDDKEILWIGTLSDGLIRFNKVSRKSQVYNLTTGLPNNTIYSIIPGNHHQLWCSSNKGIFAFDKTTGDIRSYTSRDGLIDDEFNRYYYMVLPDTSIAFGGPMGYTIFKPGMLKADEFDPVVRLTNFSVSNLAQLPASLTNLKELRLTHHQNFITAEFAAMQFDFPDKIQYRYQLSGFDTNWIISGNGNKVLYTSLPPGDYNLLLNASNTSGKWSSHIYSIHIVIAPPFWKTWWFYLITGITLCLLIYLLVQARIRRIKKAHAQQLQFEREAMELHAMALRAQMNPHFIFNCLNSIKALIQEKQDKNAVKYLTTFVSLIRKQLNNSSNLVMLNEELQTCKLYLELESMRFDGRIDFHFDIAEDEMVRKALVPPLTLQPVIENAIIHGLLPSEEGGRIEIKVYRKQQQVICEIKDNGIGRAASAKLKEKSSPLHQSKGIHLLKERMTLHSQFNSMETVDLHDANGLPAGTLVIIKFNSNYD